MGAPDPDAASRRGRAWTAAALAGLTLGALALRVALGERGGMWRDEAQFLWVVRIPTLRGMLAFLREHESHPPLFYLMMRGWLRLFGDTERAALALPILIGSALVPLAGAAGTRLFGRGAGLMAATLVAASPLLADHSALARPYSLLPLLCLASVTCLALTLESGGRAAWVGYVAATLGMLLTHNWAWLVLATEGLAVAVVVCLRGWRRARGVVPAWVVIGVGYLPWLPTFLDQCRHAGHYTSALDRLNAFVLVEASSTVGGPLSIPLFVTAYGVIAAAAVRGGGRAPGAAGYRRRLLLLAAVPPVSFALASALSFRTGLVMVRCQLTTAPCLLLALAGGLAARKTAGPPLLLAFLLTFALNDYFNLGNAKSNAREVARAVATRARPSDLIVIAPPWSASPFNYYFDGRNEQVDYPFGDRVGAIYYDRLRDRLADPRPMREARARLARARELGGRVWFVTSLGDCPRDVPDGDRFPDGSPPGTYNEAGQWRACQLRRELRRAYGDPAPVLAPGGERARDEVLCAFLFGG